MDTLKATLEQIATNGAFHIYSKDINGKYLECNKTRAEAFGFCSSKELIGKSDFDFMPKDIANQIHSNELEAHKTGNTQIIEEPFINAKREMFLHLVHRFPLKDQLGTIIGTYCLTHDITERKKVEHLVQQEKEHLEATLNSILTHLPGHVYWKDINSVILGCNDLQAQSAGLSSREDIVGKTDYEMPWKDDADMLRKSDLEVINRKKTLTFEETSKTANSDKLSVFLSKKTPLRNKYGDVIGILGISIDITDRKEMEEKLQKAKINAEAANRAKTAFIGNMSHDIRTPLSGLVGLSQLLVDREIDSKQKQQLQWIHESGEQLLELLNGILDVVSADNVSELDLDETSFDIRQCIHGLVQLEKPSTEFKGLELLTTIDETVPQYIITDRTKLHRILLNLLGNAIKFTKKGRVLIEVKYLSTHQDRVNLQFRVQDTGIGIPKALQDKVFDRFFRVSPSDKGLYTGHGLGLHIAQSYISLLGSEIKLKSQENVGTVFYFDLFLKFGQKNTNLNSKSTQFDWKEGADPLKNSPTDHVPAKSSSRAPLLLLVEDNLIAQNIVQAIAKKSGWNLICAANGKSALELTIQHRFDLIITDIGLPDISGTDLTRKLRNREALHHKNPIPIIGLTAHVQAKIKNECLLSGMNDVFSKPINSALIQIIKDKYITQYYQSVKQENSFDANDSPKELESDLTSHEHQLFEIDSFSLLDRNQALQLTGNNTVLLDSILHSMIDQEIPEAKQSLKNAYKNDDWEVIEKIAHKMKGGTTYCGTIKLQYACQYLERYYKAGHKMLLKKLYQQLLLVMDETEAAIKVWLEDIANMKL